MGIFESMMSLGFVGKDRSKVASVNKHASVVDGILGDYSEMAKEASLDEFTGTLFPVIKPSLESRVEKAGYVLGSDEFKSVMRDVTAGLMKCATSNEDVMDMFSSDSFPKNKRPNWGTNHLKINKEQHGWSLVNYSTPIAHRHENGSVAMNADKYSVTTSKIQNQLRRSLSGHGVGFEETNEAGIRKHIDGGKTAAISVDEDAYKKHLKEQTEKDKSDPENKLRKSEDWKEQGVGTTRVSALEESEDEFKKNLKKRQKADKAEGAGEEASGEEARDLYQRTSGVLDPSNTNTIRTNEVGGMGQTGGSHTLFHVHNADGKILYRGADGTRAQKVHKGEIHAEPKDDDGKSYDGTKVDSFGKLIYAQLEGTSKMVDQLAMTPLGVGKVFSVDGSHAFVTYATGGQQGWNIGEIQIIAQDDPNYQTYAQGFTNSVPNVEEVAHMQDAQLTASKTATGEMSQDEAENGDDWGYWQDVVKLLGGDAAVHAFDVYQGPYITFGGHKFWLSLEEGFGTEIVYDETTDKQMPDPVMEPFATADIIKQMIAGAGDPINRTAQTKPAPKKPAAGEEEALDGVDTKGMNGTFEIKLKGKDTGKERSFYERAPSADSARDQFEDKAVGSNPQFFSTFEISDVKKSASLDVGDTVDVRQPGHSTYGEPKLDGSVWNAKVIDISGDNATIDYGDGSAHMRMPVKSLTKVSQADEDLSQFPGAQMPYRGFIIAADFEGENGEITGYTAIVDDDAVSEQVGEEVGSMQGGFKTVAEAKAFIDSELGEKTAQTDDYRGLTMTSPIEDVKRVLKQFFAEQGVTTLQEASRALITQAPFDDEVYDSIANAGLNYEDVLSECLAAPKTAQATGKTKYTLGYRGTGSSMMDDMPAERHPTVPYSDQRRGGGTIYDEDVTKAHTWSTADAAQKNLTRYKPYWGAYKNVESRVVPVEMDKWEDRPVRKIEEKTAQYAAPGAKKLPIPDKKHAEEAVEALSPKGFRGNQVDLSSGERSEAIGNVKTKWLATHPGMTEADFNDRLHNKTSSKLVPNGKSGGYDSYKVMSDKGEHMGYVRGGNGAMEGKSDFVAHDKNMNRVGRYKSQQEAADAVEKHHNGKTGGLRVAVHSVYSHSNPDFVNNLKNMLVASGVSPEKLSVSEAGGLNVLIYNGENYMDDAGIIEPLVWGQNFGTEYPGNKTSASRHPFDKTAQDVGDRDPAELWSNADSFDEPDATMEESLASAESEGALEHARWVETGDGQQNPFLDGTPLSAAWEKGWASYTEAKEPHIASGAAADAAGERLIDCPRCEGRGTLDSGRECGRCHGEGWIAVYDGKKTSGLLDDIVGFFANLIGVQTEAVDELETVWNAASTVTAKLRTAQTDADPALEASIKEWLDLKRQISDAETRLKDIKPELQQAFADADKNMIRVNEVVYKALGQKISPSYKGAFELALKKVNGATKAILASALEAATNVTDVFNVRPVKP